jgi:hypothetical protein
VITTNHVDAPARVTGKDGKSYRAMTIGPARGEALSMDFEKMSDREVVTYIDSSVAEFARTAAVAEIQRRTCDAIREFNKQSSQQTKTMINLTWAIVVLTVVLGAIAFAQACAMLKGGA